MGRVMAAVVAQVPAGGKSVNGLIPNLLSTYNMYEVLDLQSY